MPGPKGEAPIIQAVQRGWMFLGCSLVLADDPLTLTQFIRLCSGKQRFWNCSWWATFHGPMGERGSLSCGWWCSKGSISAILQRISAIYVHCESRGNVVSVSGILRSFISWQYPMSDFHFMGGKYMILPCPALPCLPDPACGFITFANRETQKDEPLLLISVSNYIPMQ